jgi:hypothetical protein
MITQRPRALVERELQARIEAQTAEGYFERRRAAKAARRIAALPPSLWEAGALIEDPVTWNSAPSIVIDLPTSAIHEVKPQPVPVVVPDREPIALVAPVIELTKADNRVDDDEGDAPRRPRLFAATIERWHQRRPRRIEIEVEDDPQEPVVDVARAEPAPKPVAVVPEPEPVVALAPEPPPTVIAPEPEPEPAVAVDPPKAPVEVREPAPVRTPARHEPRGAVDWEKSDSLWSNRVFNSRSQPVKYASWPRQPTPRDDLAREYIDAQVPDE